MVSVTKPGQAVGHGQRTQLFIAFARFFQSPNDRTSDLTKFIAARHQSTFRTLMEKSRSSKVFEQANGTQNKPVHAPCSAGNPCHDTEDKTKLFENRKRRRAAEPTLKTATPHPGKQQPPYGPKETKVDEYLLAKSL